MVLNGGTFEGKRILSESAVKQMTSKQTPDSIKDGYGRGLSTGSVTVGHGGAFARKMSIDAKRGLITVWLLQASGYPGKGNEAEGGFHKAAMERFGVSQKYSPGGGLRCRIHA